VIAGYGAIRLHCVERSRDRGEVALNRSGSASLAVVMSTVLFFVRVNQVLVRLWARAMEAGRCLAFIPSSGRCLTGKAFVMATSWKAPQSRAARVQRRECEMIRTTSVLLKERTSIRVLCRND
jgi:hypothetical protein